MRHMRPRDGQRRREVAALTNLSRDRILWIRDVIDMAEAVMEYISSWEPEDEDDELDEDALWQPVRARWSQYGMLTLGVEFGVRDKEKEGFSGTGRQYGREGDAGIGIAGRNRCFRNSPQAFRYTVRPEENRRRWIEGNRRGRRFRENRLLTGVRTLLQRLLIGEYDIRFLTALKRRCRRGIL